MIVRLPYKVINYDYLITKYLSQIIIDGRIIKLDSKLKDNFIILYLFDVQMKTIKLRRLRRRSLPKNVIQKM